jgi:hypothetical protein
MAVLGESDRVACWAQWMRDNLVAAGFTKTQLRAAVDAADTWANDNASSFNTALPTAFRNSATSAQKALLLMIVVARRHLVGA